ncbi:hypothetical protein BTJ40_14540 [Microbulbifer sp. A4B17]|uniref:DUF4174 domain-containing protein n=1 Tax=Microbulbifer sp. A4B17 TaxID=359370 RepID=UPI000D52D399|nr:DUF4174 domain-containing protein [Microbulbifer sp. A4B17]AWF81943.1 hypothetical protein BTJ40_14540 [Microbulbifer sp. A4B17]
MHKSIVLILVLFISPTFAQGSTVSSLKDFQWKNRILLLNIPENPDSTINELLKLAPQFAERNLIWFLFSNGTLETNFPGEVTDNFASNVRNKYLQGSGMQVILIGKDGGVKYRSNTFSAVEIFQRIDSMPMRRDEMQ